MNKIHPQSLSLAQTMRFGYKKTKNRERERERERVLEKEKESEGRKNGDKKWGTCRKGSWRAC
jgi:hypothetical protein